MAKDFIPSTHPLTPPLTEEVWLDWLRLLRSHRVGVTTFFRLMTEYNSAAAALDALPGIAADAGVSGYRVCSAEAALREWQSSQQVSARPIAYGSPEYPARLADIPDPPPILWCIGDAAILNRPVVALVGARNASSLGTRMARKLAADLGAEGYVVVSGLARGIDTAAHLATLDTGTIAVMAGGVDVIYPSENAVLGQEIEEKGLRLSEQPVSLAPQARHFPRRNRIISGLAEAVIVVEAAAKSGSLITARCALDQGRDVLAVPGHPFDARASGCNMLIRDGAVLVRSAKDVLEAIAAPSAQRRDTEKPIAPPPARAARNTAETRALHSRILDRLGPSPIPEDQLIRDMKADPGTLSPEIATLEMEGRIRREAGGMICRVV
jgi:DNA processing protein